MARAGCAQAVCMECVPPTECAGVRHREGLRRVIAGANFDVRMLGFGSGFYALILVSSTSRSLRATRAAHFPYLSFKRFDS